MGPEALAQVLRPLSTTFTAAAHPRLLVGLEGPDDAAVYKLNDEQAVVQTVAPPDSEFVQRSTSVAVL